MCSILEFTDAKGAKVSITSAAPIWLVHQLVYVHIDGTQTGGSFGLTETWGALGDMPPLHVHQREDETLYVLEGEVTLFIGDRQITLTKGQAALAPRGIAHSYRIESERAGWLVVASPAGYEQFVRDAGMNAPERKLPPQGRQVDLVALAETAARYGIEILGPPGMLPA